MNSLNKGHACKKKKNKHNFFLENYTFETRKTTESTYALYPVPGYFSTGLVLIKLNTHCYAENKRTVILRNNKQDNALLLFLINFLHEHIYRTQNMCQVSYHSTPDLNQKTKKTLKGFYIATGWIFYTSPWWRAPIIHTCL